MIRLALIALFFAVLGGCAATVPVRGDDGARLLVTIRYDAADNLHGNVSEHYRRPGTYGAGPNAEPVLNAIAAEYAITRVSGWPMRALGVHCEVYAIARGVDADALASRLAHDPRVDSAEPMRDFHTLTTDATMVRDSYRSLQHALDTLQVDAAHAMSRGSGVRVAIIDSGIDARHRDLSGAVEDRRDFTSSSPLAPHGTEVAGVIGARDAGGTGIVGVAPEAELVDLRACSAAKTPGAPADCDSFTLAQALDYAVNAHVDVINLSLAGPYDPLLARLLDAAEANGIAVVAAAAPGGARDAFPASIPTVIAAASIEGTGANPATAVRAPGTDVLTTFPGDRYDYGSGSSLASAHVAGVVALMRSFDRRIDPAGLRALFAAHRPLSAVAILQAESAQLARR